MTDTVWAQRAAIAVLASFLTLAAAESGMRGWRARWHSRAEREADVRLFVQADPTLGWRATPNRKIPLDDTGRRFTTDHRGWRRYDVPDSRPLLLVLGDSFTHAAEVPDGAVYYDVVARRLDLAVVALGVNGYGTVQQWLVAREEAARLPRPAAVLLQMTDNDVINNSSLLERRSFLNNNLMPRPYLTEGGGVHLHDPRRLHEQLVLGRELTRYWLARHWPTIETAIERGAPEALELYRRELRHTAHALRLVRQVFPHAPAYAFDVSEPTSRMARSLRDLAREAGFAYLDIGRRLREEAETKRFVQADGAHWNETGHAIAGRLLAQALAGLSRE